jgi:hypothetical protein
MGTPKKKEAAAGNSEVAVIENTGGVPAELMQELMADAQEFRETMTREDMAIPFIQVLQQLSPQCVEGDPAYIENAKAGMFFNTVTNEVFDGKGDGIQLVSIAYKASYIEWVPRNAGGGFVNEYDVAEGASIRTARNDNGLDIIQSGSPLGTPGNQLSYTHTHYVFMVRPDGTYEPALLTMTSTQVKHSKKLNFQIANLKLPGSAVPAPRFFGLWRGQTEMNKNDQGIWYTWKFSRIGSILDLGELGAAIYAAAKDFARSVAAGETKADYSKTDAGAAGSGGRQPGSRRRRLATAKDVPF